MNKEYDLNTNIISIIKIEMNDFALYANGKKIEIASSIDLIQEAKVAFDRLQEKTKEYILSLDFNEKVDVLIKGNDGKEVIAKVSILSYLCCNEFQLIDKKDLELIQIFLKTKEKMYKVQEKLYESILLR